MIKPIIVDHEDGLAQMSLEWIKDRYSNKLSVDNGASRNALSASFDPNTVYSFIRTVANPEAIEILPKYVGKREGFSADWDVRKRVAKDSPEFVPGAHDDCNGLWFSPDVMNLYLKVLECMTKEKIGKENYTNFRMIQTSGIHNNDIPQETISSPVIHAIQCINKDSLVKERCEEQRTVGEFRKIAENMNSDQVYELLKAIEVPHNYRMGEINTLRKLKIEPLVVEDRAWQCSGRTLRNAVDFLVPFTISVENSKESHSWNEDY
ncbi:MAG: hypothetical protein KJ697_03925 [Nanoarchaeota archaeon]|nr:hypothetical protein [Nanoarchaeota archaeon]